jgi:hypothetical protein
MDFLSETLTERLQPHRVLYIQSNQGIFWGFHRHLIWIFQSHQRPLSPLGRFLYSIGFNFEDHHHPENLNLLNI